MPGKLCEWTLESLSVLLVSVVDAEKSHVNKGGKGSSSSVTANKKSTASSPAIIIDAPQGI